MRIIEEIEKTTKYTKTTNILCNKCGESMRLKGEYNEMTGCSILIYFDYGSNKDCETHNFDICDGCYDEFIASFKHKPCIS